MIQNDCIVVMSTGKSLLYQLPSVLSKQVTLVVNPLKSSILQQTIKMNTIGIKAKSLSGSHTMEEVSSVYSALEANPPEISLLYIRPEKLFASDRVQNLISRLHENSLITRIVIDDAQYIPRWGTFFREDYGRLNILRELYPIGIRNNAR